MAKTYNPKGKRAPLIDKDMNTFPINLFFRVFYDFDKDKFDRTYTDNIKVFFDIYKYDTGFIALYKTMKDGMSVLDLHRLWSMSTDKINDEMNNAIACIKHNKDAVFSGFRNSKLRSKVVTRLMQDLVGINRFTSMALVDAGLYSINDINYLKTSSELIDMIRKSTNNPNTVGKIFSDTLVALNRCGFDTSKFGYTGIETKKKSEAPKRHMTVYPTDSTVCNIVGYSYNGFSTTTFKVKCPNCGGFFRIHITGHINEEGRLEIEHTTATDNDTWYCENCMKQIQVDKVTKFLKNYLA